MCATSAGIVFDIQESPAVLEGKILGQVLGEFTLLRYAVAKSWFYTFGGRVNLSPVANIDFYLKRKFPITTVTDPKTGDDAAFAP